MTEDVTKDESQSSSAPSVDSKEQGNDGQAVEKQDQHSTDIVENYKRAMQKEREKRKKLQEQLNQVKAQPQSQEEDDPYDQEKEEFEQIKADNLITRKLVSDPTFKDRVDLVKDYMEQHPGVDVDQADDAVLANFTRSALSEAKQVTQPVPNQITTSAVPETSAPPPRANLDDVIDGKGTTGIPELDNSFRKLAGGTAFGVPRTPGKVIRDPSQF